MLISGNPFGNFFVSFQIKNIPKINKKPPLPASSSPFDNLRSLPQVLHVLDEFRPRNLTPADGTKGNRYFAVHRIASAAFV
jgi:hypothetical protein